MRYCDSEKVLRNVYVVNNTVEKTALRSIGFQSCMCACGLCITLRSETMF